MTCSLWPQYSVIAWLLVSIVSAIGAAVRPGKGWIMLGPNQRRIAAIGFAMAATMEAGLLWCGSFFQGIL